ncbi:Acyl-CoA dehydrogenase domain protein [Pseudomonas syringae pv. aptata]|uniref:Acyl-CoA dehydrogenase domain protein n=1 Tax=Pseudomonas syringae pv. aptata TaxID=83167 RepID=A0A3M5X6Z5_PSEAP|nr:Acyl-CoA dehydrogenase domain protein [Pseudomonas syringae pv. aptata]
MIDALSEFLDWRKHGYADTRALGECLQALVNEGLDQLPLPARGQTLERWRATWGCASCTRGTQTPWRLWRN